MNMSNLGLAVILFKFVVSIFVSLVLLLSGILWGLIFIPYIIVLILILMKW